MMLFVQRIGTAPMLDRIIYALASPLAREIIA